jgi:GxxExxY protein
MNLPDKPNQIPHHLRESNEKQDPETYAIIGAAMAVHRELGSGFLENVYQAALERELIALGIPHEREKETPIFYRGQALDTNYRADFICFGKIIIELKALSNLSNHATAQALNYLKATKLNRALVINFGAPSLQHKRIVLTH